MDWILSLVHFIICAVVISKWRFFRVPEISTQMWLSLFTLKVLSGISLWAIFIFFYGDRANSDALVFFDDAKVIYQSLKSDPIHFFQLLFGIGLDQPELQGYINEMVRWNKPFGDALYNDNRTIIRFNAICMILSFGAYHVHTVYINFLAMIGLVALYKALKNQIEINHYLLVGIIFLAPSLLFWGSGVLKEPLVMFCLGLFYYSFSKLFSSNWNWKSFISMIVFAIFLIFIKPYVLLCLIPGITFLVVTQFKLKKTVPLFIAWHFLLLILLLFSNEIFNTDLIKYLAKKQIDFYNVARDWNAGSSIEIASIANKWSIIENAPQALINCYFRPFLHEMTGALYALSAGENLLYVLLIIITAFYFKKPNTNNTRFLLAWFSIFICGGVLIGLTTPVLGAVVRYKAPFLPFFGLFIAGFLDFDKLTKRVNGFLN